MPPPTLLRVAAAAIILGVAVLRRDGQLYASALIVTSPSCRIGWQHHVRNQAAIRTVLYASPGDDDAENDGESLQDSESGDGALDLDQQKIVLENMLKSSSDNADETLDKGRSILTTSRKQRLEREIQLLKMLDPEHPGWEPGNASGDLDLQNQEFVMSELWKLWYGERGPLNEKKLHDIEAMLADSSLWVKAENAYLTLIREHCSTDGSIDNLDLSNWVEPANRLATLLYLMGRLKESKQWCERILLAKPWHLGALSGVVMVCMKMGDRSGIMKYSVMGMPNLSDQMRDARKDWVQKNVELAEKNLSRLEKMNMEAYGDPDTIVVDSIDKDSTDENTATETDQLTGDDMGGEDTAWQ